MSLLQNPMLIALGWTLLHSLWQLAAIAAIGASLLQLFRHASSNSRYGLSCICLLAMGAAPVWTYTLLISQTTLHTQSTQAAPHKTAGNISTTPIAPLPVTRLPSVRHQLWLSARIETTMESVLPTASLLYLAGCTLMLLRLSVNFYSLRRLRLTATSVSTDHQALLRLQHTRMSLRKPVQLRTSSHIEVPTLLGYARPLILLPATALTGLSTEHLACLLLHELAHIRRHDYLANTLQTLLETLLFYHPAVYWLSAIIRQEREHCCDDLTARMAGSRLEYARALTAMEALRTSVDTLSTQIALATHTGDLLPRIQRLLQLSSPASTRNRSAPAAALLGAATLLLLWLAPAVAQTTPASSQEERVVTSPSPASTTPAHGHETKVATFDIRDLLIVPSAPAAHLSADQEKAERQRDLDALVKRIVDTIQDTIDSPSWHEHGGSLGDIHESQGFLIVRQSPKNIRRIESFLKQLGAARSPHVSIESRIMFVSETTFQKLSVAYPSILRNTINHDGSCDTLTDKQLAGLLQETTSDVKTISLASPRITLFNSQRARVEVPPWKRNAAPKNAGVRLDVEATATQDQQSIAVSIALEANLARQGKPIKISALASVPDGHTLLLGQTIPADAPGSRPQLARLILLVRPKTIAVKDMERSFFDSDQMPAKEDPAFN